jgi:hypothetical protein
MFISQALKKSGRIFLLILLFCSMGRTQLSSGLRDYLWQNNFSELLQKYADEEVDLKDKGELEKQIEARAFSEEPGMRIQVFAGADKENAEKMSSRLQTLDLDSVYVVNDGGLYKVQLGNFIQEQEAQKMLDRLFYAGIKNAWVVKTSIHVPKQREYRGTQTDSLLGNTENGARMIYSIQLFVTSNPGKAKNLEKQFLQKLSLNVWSVPQDHFWKVMAGKFKDETSARNALGRIRQSGFPDAWITQVQENF